MLIRPSSAGCVCCSTEALLPPQWPPFCLSSFFFFCFIVQVTGPRGDSERSVLPFFSAALFQPHTLPPGTSGERDTRESQELVKFVALSYKSIYSKIFITVMKPWCESLSAPSPALSLMSFNCED